MEVETEVTIKVTCPHCGKEFETAETVVVEVEPNDSRDDLD